LLHLLHSRQRRRCHDLSFKCGDLISQRLRTAAFNTTSSSRLAATELSCESGKALR
jgi:hypothetical protein